MTADFNRKLMTDIMNATARGDMRPFAEAMHDDFTFRPMAASRKGVWADAYPGKQRARAFFRAWHAQMDGGMTNTPASIFADGDYVNIESQGAAKMKSGDRYDQRYCMVLRLAGGKIMEMREYFDSGLADALFEKVEA
jgi:ketosteroid isomerase-like protein